MDKKEKIIERVKIGLSEIKYDFVDEKDVSYVIRFGLKFKWVGNCVFRSADDIILTIAKNRGYKGGKILVSNPFIIFGKSPREANSEKESIWIPFEE